MRVIISGPKRMPYRDRPDDPWPHMRVQLEMDAVPAPGEHITLNSGSTVIVKRRFWYVQGPENQDWFTWDADYKTDQAEAEVVHLDVLPSDYDEPFTPDKMQAEGIGIGREQAAAEVEKLLDLASGEYPAETLAMLRKWCADGAARTRERTAQAERHAALAEQILAELAAEREQEDAGPS
jgi:hypothetical protein